jgi:GntR family transcriptional regulator, galactonate operon transcriptional repressor
MIYTTICLTREGAKFVKKRRRPRPTPRAAAPKRERPKWYVVCDVVGRDIVTGKLLPGALLPIEADLARELEVSRPSLREGLRALAAKGLVETRTRRGTIVRAKACWDILDPDVLAWMADAPPDQEFLMALLELRTSIEPAAARLAAQRASPRQVLEIEQSYRAMAASLPDDIEACCQHDLDLHERIIAAAGNVFLARFAAVIRTALRTSFVVSYNARESYENSLAEHWAVADAIRRREPGEAERAMRLLLKGTARDLAPAFPLLKPGQAEPQPRGRRAGASRPRRKILSG